VELGCSGGKMFSINKVKAIVPVIADIIYFMGIIKGDSMLFINSWRVTRDNGVCSSSSSLWSMTKRIVFFKTI